MQSNDVHAHLIDGDSLAADTADPTDKRVGEPGPTTFRPAVLGRRHAAATTHYLATAAAIRLLEAGGNAVDAGVAAGLCLGVLEPHMTNIGGVAPIVVFDAATRQVHTIAGLGTWPRAATLAAYMARYGHDMPLGIPQSVVPGGMDAWLVALQRFGTKSFAEVARPAIELAADGFPIYPRLHYWLTKSAAILRAMPTSAAVFLHDGQVPPVRSVLRQTALARTLDRLASAERNAEGSREERLQAVRDAFYRGPIARELVAFAQAHGSFLSTEDVAGFAAPVEPPVMTTYRERYQVLACGAWCQGPVLLMALNIVEQSDLRSLGHNTPAYLHLLVEALKLAFADRERYFGDPRYVQVPLDTLLSKAYAAQRGKLIDPHRAWPELPPAGDATGQALASKLVGVSGGRGDDDPSVRDTSYVAVVDAAGNAFSATPSDPAFSSPLVPELGIIISSRGRQFWLDPDHPSVIAPGKRPRLTPNPALALRDGQVFLAFGCPGGDGQTQAMLQVFLNVVEFGMNPQEAVEAPRVQSHSFPSSFWPHTYTPNRLSVEERVPAEVFDGLRALGHGVEWWPALSPALCAVCAVQVDPATGTRVAGADPRRDAYALAG